MHAEISIRLSANNVCYSGSTSVYSSCEEKVQILQNGISEIAAILIGVANTSSAHGVQLLYFDEC